jgi:hypothetical protein
MTGLLLLSVVLAAADAGVPPPSGARAAADAGTPPRKADAGVRTDARHVADAGVHTADVRSAPDGGTLGRDGGSRGTSIDGAPLPATRIAVQEPATPDAGQSRKKKARADRTDGQSDPKMDALLEQSRAQTEALQQIAGQQRAYEDARIADQQARTQRAAAVDGARSNIDGAVQSLQASGSWDAASLRSTRASLQQTAAAATAANAPAEASRASQAASLIDAAEAALAQRNAQQAQYYLLQANQLLGGGGAQNLGY